MGNGCSGTREKLDEQTERAKVHFGRAYTYSKTKYFEAKDEYGPQIKEKYEEARMKMHSYRPEKINDTS